jgi:hypothetical protein
MNHNTTWLTVALLGWALSATTLAAWHAAQRRRSVRPVRVRLNPNGVATTTHHVDSVMYW